MNFLYVTRSLIAYFKLVRNTDSIDPMTNSSMLRPLWCGAYCKTHIWSTSICTNTNICLTDLYHASMVSSGLIYKLEKLADEAILSEAFAIIPLWKFRAETPPGFWNSKLHLITSPCLQNSNQEPPPSLLYRGIMGKSSDTKTRGANEPNESTSCMFVYKVLFEFLEFTHPRLLLISLAIRLQVVESLN